MSAPPALVYRAVVLAVSVNGSPGDPGALFLEDQQGHLFAPTSFMAEWNFRRFDELLIGEGGAAHVDLEKIQGLSYHWDHALSELAIQAEPAVFVNSQITLGNGGASQVAPYTPGVFLNYDAALTSAPGISSRQVLVEVGAFRGKSLVTSSFTTGTEGRTRLLSSYQTDQTDALKTLRVGDSFNSTGAWGRGVLFGGVQYGTNFAIRPEFVTMALPSISGKALLPSTLDIYVNNVLRTRKTVKAGPFSLKNLPVNTGSGEVQMVVTDLLGREQLVTQSFFASPELLREGLVQSSYELGWLRENYGFKSNDYSDFFAAATHRKGLTPHLTGELRMELQRDLAVAGGSAAVAFPAISSVIESSVALSHARGAVPGALARVNYSYLGRRWSASAWLQRSSPSFRQLGSDPDNLLAQSSAVQVSAPVGRGALSLNYFQRQFQGEASTRIANLNYSHRLGKGAFVSFSLFKPLSQEGALSVASVLTIVLDQKHVASASYSGHAGVHSLYTEFQKSTPLDEGMGYRVAALGGGDSVRQELSVSRDQSFARFQADLVRQDAAYSARLSAQGGIATLGDEVYFARGFEDGFAIVEVKGLPKVPIYLENQVVAHTNARGRAVVSHLRPYQMNRISLDPLSLTMETSIKSLEKTVVPRNQGGILVDFEVEKTLRATLRVVLADGSALPPWTPVEVLGVTDTFVSGLRGEVSVELPQRTGNQVIAHLANAQACTLRVDVSDEDLTVPVIGPLPCLTVR